MDETLTESLLSLDPTVAYWQLWGPTRCERVGAHKVDLAVFRLTGEWPVAIAAEEQGYLVKTQNHWVFATPDL